MRRSAAGPWEDVETLHTWRRESRGKPAVRAPSPQSTEEADCERPELSSTEEADCESPEASSVEEADCESHEPSSTEASDWGLKLVFLHGRKRLGIETRLPLP